MQVFELIISPFYYIVEQFYLLGYKLTDDHGLAIILLSFAISLLLLPIFILLERSKKRDDAVKRKMRPLLDEIKRCYKGQERYYYIRTLHRQHGYNSFKSLVPVLSLLLQIPFFIAAYQFLEHFEPLVGQSFLFIKDLSEPDGILGSINVLPIIMTLVNLVTAYLYTRNGDKAERKQMLVVAGVFLVLLYNFPSGLVLYWTMNNVFSFFRLFITNPEDFRTKEPLWKFSPASLFQFRVKPVFFMALSFLALYLFVSGKLYYLEDNHTLLTISLALLVICQVTGIIYFFRIRGGASQVLFHLSSAFLLATFLFQALNVYVFTTGEAVNLNLFNIHIQFAENQLSDIIYPGILFLFITLPFYFREEGVLLAGPGNSFRPGATGPKVFRTIFILSAAYLFGYIILWNPLIVFSSFPETFNFTALELIWKNLPVLVIFLAASILIFFITPRRFRWLLAVAALTAVAISFIHNTIFPIETGTLQENRFEKEQALIVSPYLYLVEGFALIALFGAALFLLRKQYFRQIIAGLILLNVILISQSIYRAVSSNSFTRNETLFHHSTHTISFSKTEKNVVYFIPDMFQGWAMHRMMNENPELKEQLNGFVWYPNALAVSRVTNTSVGPLIGGHGYAPDLLDLDSEHTVQEKLSKAKRDLSNEVRRQGYRFTSNRLTYCNIENEYYDTFLPDWHNDWDKFNSRLGVQVTKETNYALLCYNALFFSAPLALKPKIYNNGQWLFRHKEGEGRVTSTSLKHQFLRVLPYISNNRSDKGNFVLIYSMVSHFPWSIVNENGSMKHDVSPYENNKWIIETLNSWFKWMKKNGVYDNTKIIIVSDHGTHWKRFNRELDIDNPFKNVDDERGVPLNYMLDLNPVILVKDFNSTEPFSEDWRFMSNMDAPDIALERSDPTKGAPPETRTLPAFVSWWTQDMNNRTKFSLEHKYLVEDDIFDANNWTMVWDKHRGKIETEKQ
ncbi:MAG: membrane protein insertase YidC [Bacteroidales bacterium]